VLRLSSAPYDVLSWETCFCVQADTLLQCSIITLKGQDSLTSGSDSFQLSHMIVAWCSSGYRWICFPFHYTPIDTTQILSCQPSRLALSQHIALFFPPPAHVSILFLPFTLARADLQQPQREAQPLPRISDDRSVMPLLIPEFPSY
jgi:hypothetical protein